MMRSKVGVLAMVLLLGCGGGASAGGSGNDGSVGDSAATGDGTMNGGDAPEDSIAPGDVGATDSGAQHDGGSGDSATPGDAAHPDAADDSSAPESGGVDAAPEGGGTGTDSSTADAGAMDGSCAAPAPIVTGCGPFITMCDYATSYCSGGATANMCQPLPAACQCAETHDCACLLANAPPCDAGSHFCTAYQDGGELWLLNVGGCH